MVADRGANGRHRGHRLRPPSPEATQRRRHFLMRSETDFAASRASAFTATRSSSFSSSPCGQFQRARGRSLRHQPMALMSMEYSFDRRVFPAGSVIFSGPQAASNSVSRSMRLCVTRQHCQALTSSAGDFLGGRRRGSLTNGSPAISEFHDKRIARCRRRPMGHLLRILIDEKRQTCLRYDHRQTAHHFDGLEHGLQHGGEELHSNCRLLPRLLGPGLGAALAAASSSFAAKAFDAAPAFSAAPDAPAADRLEAGLRACP